VLVMVDSADEMADIVQVGGRLQHEALFRPQGVQHAVWSKMLPASSATWRACPSSIPYLLPSLLDGDPDLVMP